MLPAVVFDAVDRRSDNDISSTAVNQYVVQRTRGQETVSGVGTTSDKAQVQTAVRNALRARRISKELDLRGAAAS